MAAGAVPCECCDAGCVAHRGQTLCERPAANVLRRVDMTDVTGTLMCEPCTGDAIESGVFNCVRLTSRTKARRRAFSRAVQTSREERTKP